MESRILRRTRGSVRIVILASLTACSGGGRDLPPDVILISIDTLRADHVGCYGYERDTTPFLDSFAQESVLFERNTTPGGGTLPIHMSMMTSLFPRAHGLHPDTGKKGERRLEDERTTLAETLRAAGYRTAAFTGGGWVRREFGFDQGFETFDDQGRGFREIMPRAREWLRANRAERPLFLFLHTYDVHSGWETLPYSAPGDYDGLYLEEHASELEWCHQDDCASRYLSWINRSAKAGEVDPREHLGADKLEALVALYDGGIRYVDDQLKSLFAFLDELDLYDDALIVVTSDHGEEFLEHGLLLHLQEYAETAFVPLLVRLPGGRHAGRRVASLVSTVDLMPTVLDAADLLPSTQAQGRSLLPVIEGNPQGRDPIHGRTVIRGDGWSYFSETGELFRTAEDPGERNDLADVHPDVRDRLAAELDRLARRDRKLLGIFRKRASPTESRPLSKELVERLGDLGYVDVE